ncbi:hypothetical protein SAMN05660284_00977 [Formivibrio citricus]|uniref:Calcineurin-like phosphoesterase domain-containing protein n=1 Tax=Formivibrio citricus TaxID=83765 RepID=A0A1I4XE53_9NEIS|nr:metallophosphoesterase [Formivibrio citricus]SFN23952.1 hypothetical protein SAMN05660284_00977 [Formivibrio citricus]
MYQFHILTGLIALYVIGRLVLPLPWKTGAKCLAALGLFSISQHHLVTRTWFGTLASPEVPFAGIVVLGWLFGALLLLASFLFLKDVAAALLFLLRKAGLKWSLPSSHARWAGALSFAAFALSAIGVWQSVKVPEVHTVEITLKRLPPELDGLRLVQITDLHASKLFQGPWVRAVVERVNALNPDLILVTGDVIDGTPDVRAQDVAPLADLKARHGVFAALGNHEYYSNLAGWTQKFRELGFNLLLNEHVVIKSKGRALVLAGVTDRAASRFAATEPDIRKALAGVPKDAPIVLMDHQPRGARINAAAGVGLQFSGHTHGGQILGLRVVSQIVNEGFISGLYQVGAMQLYVGNGAGLWAGFPVRLGVQSEIAQIVLRATPGKETSVQAQ